MKTDKTLLVEYLAYKYLYLKRGYRLALEVHIPHELTKLVKIPDGSSTPIVDIMGIDISGQVVCVEIKTTLNDFKSKHGHNFYGHYNYYAVPYELYQKVKDLVPDHVGIIVVDTTKHTTKYTRYTVVDYNDPRVVKKAKKQKVDFDKEPPYWIGKRIIDEVNYNIITAQTSSIMTFMYSRIKDVKGETQDEPI